MSLEFPPGIIVIDVLYELVEQVDHHEIEAFHLAQVVQRIERTVVRNGFHTNVIALGYENITDSLVYMLYPHVVSVSSYNVEWSCEGGAMYRRLL